jgi:hypothetical protein
MKYWYDKESQGLLCEPDCVDEWLDLIWAIGFDYDGYHNAKDLKELIDELVDMTKKASRCLHEGKLFMDEEADRISFEVAIEERNKDVGGTSNA